MADRILKSYYYTLFDPPIIELSGYTRAHGLAGKIYAYLDFGGPTGTAKDGLAECMLTLARQSGELRPGQTVIETASGTFAVALTLAARNAGHPVVLAVPEGIPEERKKLLKAMGARLEYSSTLYGRKGAEKLARELAQTLDGYYMNYMANDHNCAYHRSVTGHNIAQAIYRLNEPSLVDAVVVGVGSGGTITGVGETVKAWTSDVRIVAVEPYECQALGGGFVGKHQIPGLGAGFVPENYNPYVVDRIAAVTSADAARAAREVLRTDSIPACVSAGATLAAARVLMEKGISKAALCVFSGRQQYD